MPACRSAVLGLEVVMRLLWIQGISCLPITTERARGHKVSMASVWHMGKAKEKKARRGRHKNTIYGLTELMLGERIEYMIHIRGC